MAWRRVAPQPDSRGSLPWLRIAVAGAFCIAVAACDSSAPSLSLIVENPQLMKDRTGQQVREWFGEPDFVRKDGPSQLWRYAAKKCTLELFLFQPEGATLPLKVSHFEVRPKGDAEMSERICMAEIALSR